MSSYRISIVYLSFLLLLQGCVSLRLDAGYKGPPVRPPGLAEYYTAPRSYTGFEKEVLRQGPTVSVDRFRIFTDVGELKVDYFHGNTPTKNLVFVFPVLGGKNIFENYFADYFARHGIEAAIVHRANEFKRPENLDNLEELLRASIMRDRIAIDFFEKEFQKEKFGSFGISRGAINVAITAGIDPRLEFNVMAMGGTDLVGVFEKSKQNRIQNYITYVTETRKWSREEFFEYLRKNLKTDPKNFASFIDARKTLLILSALDRTVPFHFGMKLREQIGNPRTIVLLADHYTSLLYTQFVPVFPPQRSLAVFPFDYVEGEAVNFYIESFEGRNRWWHQLPLRIVQAPFNFIASFFVK